MATLSNSYQAAIKRLSAVETERHTSNQHEINGVGALRQLLGEVPFSKRPTPWIRLDDSTEMSTSASHEVTWYDSRENQLHRSAEWRLYYRGEPLLAAGDLFLVIRNGEGELAICTASPQSTSGRQLLAIFGIPDDNGRFRTIFVETIPDVLLLPFQELLEAVGWSDRAAPDSALLTFDEVQSKFGDGFPPTRALSTFVQDRLGPAGTADETLMTWWYAEESLFRQIEDKVVTDRLATGFKDTDDFIQFSLSVQNRRKARAGLAFQHHLAGVFTREGIRFEPQARTEGQRSPDFIFPGIGEYRNGTFPADRLTLLGAKTTCKERWRQVLTEAARIPAKHLATLEPAISQSQLAEMAEEQLTIVAPQVVRSTYPSAATNTLSVEEFIALVRSRQSAR